MSLPCNVASYLGNQQLQKRFLRNFHFPTNYIQFCNNYVTYLNPIILKKICHKMSIMYNFPDQRAEQMEYTCYYTLQLHLLEAIIFIFILKDSKHKSKL